MNQIVQRRWIPATDLRIWEPVVEADKKTVIVLSVDEVNIGAEINVEQLKDFIRTLEALVKRLES